jgi:hypothetical protein
MKAVEFPSIPQFEWNEVYESSGDAWLFHSHEWIEIEARFFAQKNLSFAIQNEEGKTVGIHPLYLRQNGLGTWVERSIDCGVHRHTGMALLDHLSSAEIHSAQALGIQHIFTLAEMNDIDRIQLNAHNLAPKNLSAQREEIPFWVADYHFYLGLYFGPQGFNPAPGMVTCCADQIINLGESSEEELFQNLEESCRRAVRKAIRNDLALHSIENENAIVDYYALAQLSRERTDENLPSLEFYQYLYAQLFPLNKCRSFLRRKRRKK